jgi:RNA polymerase sigma-70 factor (ECF subfamily)
MGRLCALLLFGSATVAAGPPAPPPDQKRLQGTWEAVELTVEGRPVPADQANSFRLRVKGDRMTIGGGNVKRWHTFHLDPKKTPRALDLTPAAGALKGQRCPVGIYEWDGDKLRVCLDDRARREEARPKEFKSVAGQRIVLAVLKRVRE